MPWAKGQSGNVRGRPPKGRALTDQLSAALAQPRLFKGEMRARGALVAEMIADALVTFELVSADGQDKKLPLTAEGLLKLVTWVYSQVDGPPQPSGAGALLAVELDTMLRVIMGGADADDDADDALAPPDGVVPAAE